MHPGCKNCLIRLQTIRSLLAGMLLTLFAMGITPKLAIHALVAHHTDKHLALDHAKADQLNTAGFHCATDSLVVEFPFLDHSLSILLDSRPSFPAHEPAPLEEPLSFSHPLFGLRGPPAVC
jgi:hypothetical protein